MHLALEAGGLARDQVVHAHRLHVTAHDTGDLHVIVYMCMYVCVYMDMWIHVH